MNLPLADWANFFAAQVGASAALAGLLVVAISINLTRILSFPYLPGRAGETLILLVGALVMASIGLVPSQPARLFGAEVLAVGLVTFLAPLVNQLRSLKAFPEVSAAKKSARVIVSAAASLPFVLGGILLVADSAGGLYWVAAGVILSLAAGVWNAWVLLVEILR